MIHYVVPIRMSLFHKDLIAEFIEQCNVIRQHLAGNVYTFRARHLYNLPGTGRVILIGLFS